MFSSFVLLSPFIEICNIRPTIKHAKWLINIWSLPRFVIFPSGQQFWAVVASVTFHWKSVQGSSIVLNKGGKRHATLVNNPICSSFSHLNSHFLEYLTSYFLFRKINTVLNIYLNSKFTISPERFSSSSIGHGLEISLSFVFWVFLHE